MIAIELHVCSIAARTQLLKLIKLLDRIPLSLPDMHFAHPHHPGSRHGSHVQKLLAAPGSPRRTHPSCLCTAPGRSLESTSIAGCLG